MPLAELAVPTDEELSRWDYPDLLRFLDGIKKDDAPIDGALSVLNDLLDRRYPTGQKKRSSVVHLVGEAIDDLLARLPPLSEKPCAAARLDFASRRRIYSPIGRDQILVIDASGSPPEGDDAPSRAVVEAYQLGWRRIILFRLRGHRFIGCGLGPRVADLRVDLYGSSGDYLGSGLDGGELVVHGSAQDQVGNILKSGRVVVHGDVGQAFLYGAKGGEVYVLGNAAGRPLINAVGSPRVVINGTALDYLAESFMAGDPLDKGGFAIVNGVEYDLEGELRDKEIPYPGGNLFSLASGGAIYIRDPHRKLGEDQLNGGRFAELPSKDWDLIRTYLEENERLFGIPVERLLSVGGQKKEPRHVYRKVEPGDASH